MNMGNKKIVWTFILGFLTVLGITFISDAKQIVKAIEAFNLGYIPLILGLTFMNYLLRFVKWQYFLKLIDIQVPIKESFTIFLSGLAMSVTPGKVGEILKSILLKELKGVAVSRTLPIVFAERITDGFGMLLLSLSGIMFFHYGLQVFVVLISLLFLLLAVIHNPRWNAIFLKLCGKVPFVKKFVGVFETMFESAGQLMSFKSLILTIIIGVISWSFESLAFYYVFVGLGHPIPLLMAVFTLSSSSIIGALSMLPGGLGAAEGSIMGLLVNVVRVPGNIAAVATLIIRFCTLWFGVVLGLLALGSKRKLLANLNSIGEAGTTGDE